MEQGTCHECALSGYIGWSLRLRGMCINLNIECSVIGLRLKSLFVLKVMRAGLGIRQKISLETTYKGKQISKLFIIETSKVTLLLSNVIS